MPVRVHRMRDLLRGRTFGHFEVGAGKTRRFSEDFQIRPQGFRFDVPLLSDPATVDFSLAREPSDMVGGESEICRRLAREKIPASIEINTHPFGRRHKDAYIVHAIGCRHIRHLPRMSAFRQVLSGRASASCSFLIKGRCEAYGRAIAIGEPLKWQEIAVAKLPGRKERGLRPDRR